MPAQATRSPKPPTYPVSKTVEVTDEIHGTMVPDPYRWLEDIEAPDTRHWIDAQNKLTSDFLGRIGPRAEIHRRLTELWDYEKWGLPFRQGNRYFALHNDGLQDHAELFMMNSQGDEPSRLLDPNSWSEDGTVSLAGIGMAEDASLLAYGFSHSGSDWQEWRVIEVETKKELEDHLDGIKFSGASWTHDAGGFFYTRYADPGEERSLEGINRFPKICYHRIGDDQSKDEVTYERPDQPDWLLGGSVTEDGRYLVISASKGTESKNGLFFVDLESQTRDVVELLEDFDASYSFIGNDGPVFWILTDLGASNWRVVAIDIRNPERTSWNEIIPEGPQPIESANVVGDRFVVGFLKDACSEVKLFGLDGTFERKIEMPSLGTATGFGGKRSYTETFYYFTDFTTPADIYRYDFSTGKSTLFRRNQVKFDPGGYETKQVFASSKDGTRVPMFITHKKGIALDGTNPTCLYGYGGFRVSLTPAFSIVNIVWMEMGGIFVSANLRGGGEYGEEWHLASTKLRKQNVFDDFIAAAQWLTQNRYTSPSRLAIYGGSNGGLLVGACITQRPELFGAAVIAQGVLDMLRYHKFTIGWAWERDYGSIDDPREFKALLAYSPLHNVKSGIKYPATFIRTSDHDDRVWPGASLKFAAATQSAQAGDEPILITIETKQGHGAGTPTSRAIERSADTWAFLAEILGIA